MTEATAVKQAEAAPQQLTPSAPVSVPPSVPQDPNMQLILRHFSAADAPMALAICQAESGCRDIVSAPNSNGTRDYGRMQINSVHAAKVGGNLNALLDPETNMAIAAQIKASSGWGAWSTYKNGRYKAYLK